MKVLSLFDGIGGARLALSRVGLPVTNYYSSEVDTYCNQVLRYNWPDIAHLGDINSWRSWKLPPIDLLIAGFPCQSWSNAGLKKGLDDPRGNLFLVMLKLLKTLKPKYFLLENVRMKSEFKDQFGIRAIDGKQVKISNTQRYKQYGNSFTVDVIAHILNNLK